MRGACVYTFIMQVYVELALAENFCMDFTLLVCAKFITKNRCGFLRLALVSVAAACLAVVFPLIPLSGLWAQILKIVTGLAIAAAAGRFSRFMQYIKFAAAFMGLSFLLGGALIAIFSLAGVEYSFAQGYMLSSVPVGIPLFFALLLVLLCRALAKTIAARRSAEVECEIFLGGKSIKQKGFFDSGNRVYSGGCPVSVISAAAACAITDVTAITESVKVSTVAGSRRMKVFTADKIVIYNGGTPHTIKCVKIGISPRLITRAVLHPDLAEEEGNV